MDEQEYITVVDYVNSVPFQVTISSIQRRFRIGYNRAARHVERMLDEGVLKRDKDEPWKLWKGI